MREDIDKALKQIEERRDQTRKDTIAHWRNSGLNKFLLNQKISKINTEFSEQLKRWKESEPFREKIITYTLSLNNEDLLNEVISSDMLDAFYAQEIYVAELNSRLKKVGFIK